MNFHNFLRKLSEKILHISTIEHFQIIVSIPYAFDVPLLQHDSEQFTQYFPAALSGEGYVNCL